jgi:hypothetical protein
MIVYAPISVGELIDKITILELKMEFLTDLQKIKNVSNELTHLNTILSNLNIQDILNYRKDLKLVNKELWHIEDFKKNCEKNQTFNTEFINAARQLYIKNEIRAKIKKNINEAVGSFIIEEKNY